MDLNPLIGFLLCLIENYTLGIAVAFLPEGKKVEDLSPGKRGVSVLFSLLPTADPAVVALKVYVLFRFGAMGPTAGEILASVSHGLSQEGITLDEHTALQLAAGLTGYGGHVRRPDVLAEEEFRFDIHHLDFTVTVRDTRPKAASSESESGT